MIAHADNLFGSGHFTGLNPYGTAVFGTAGANIRKPRYFGIELPSRS